MNSRLDHKCATWRIFAALCGFGISAVNAHPPALGPDSFERVTIVAPTGGHTQAFAINNSAQVVGFYYITVDNRLFPKPFVWSRQSGFRTLPDIDYGGARSINDCGEVVGSVSTQINEDVTVTDAALWARSGQLQLLKDITTTDLRLHEAIDINERGHIIGSAFDAGEQVGFWRSSRGEVLRIPPLEPGAVMVPLALNNWDRVVGIAFVSGVSGITLHAFVWSPHRPARELVGLTDNAEAEAHDINDRGEIAGLARTSEGASRPVLWRPFQGLIELEWGAGAAEAVAINVHGISVGAGFAPEFTSNAVGWLRSGDSFLIDEPSAFTGHEAVGINDAGVVAGDEFTAPTAAVVWFPRHAHPISGIKAALCRHRFIHH